MPPFEPVTLRTARLELRRMQEGDIDAMFALFSDPRVMRHWATPPWESREIARARLASDNDDWQDGTQLRLGVVLAASRQLIGCCTLFAFHRPSRRAEVGYALASDFWGQGYMHEALCAFVAHGFEALELNRIEADIDPRNAASARSLARLGFCLEGRLRERWIVAGEVSDTDLYGLLRRDWLTWRAARESKSDTAHDTRS